MVCAYKLSNASNENLFAQIVTVILLLSFKNVLTAFYLHIFTFLPSLQLLLIPQNSCYKLK